MQKLVTSDEAKNFCQQPVGDFLIFPTSQQNVDLVSLQRDLCNKQIEDIWEVLFKGIDEEALLKAVSAIVISSVEIVM